jgi:hypothetical protein
LYRNLVAALSASGDPHQAFQLCVRRVKLMVIGAGIALRPDYQWTSVAPIIRAALLDHFGFDRRDLGQSAYLSEATALMQSIQGVDYLNITTFDAVNESTTVAELAKLAATLELRQAIPARLAQLNPLAASSDIPCVRVVPAELVFLTPEIPDTLILSQLGA